VLPRHPLFAPFLPVLLVLPRALAQSVFVHVFTHLTQTHVDVALTLMAQTEEERRKSKAESSKQSRARAKEEAKEEKEKQDELERREEERKERKRIRNERYRTKKKTMSTTKPVETPQGQTFGIEGTPHRRLMSEQDKSRHAKSLQREYEITKDAMANNKEIAASNAKMAQKTIAYEAFRQLLVAASDDGAEPQLQNLSTTG
jgi:hypothetical protein